MTTNSRFLISRQKHIPIPSRVSCTHAQHTHQPVHFSQSLVQSVFYCLFLSNLHHVRHPKPALPSTGSSRLRLGLRFARRPLRLAAFGRNLRQDSRPRKNSLYYTRPGCILQAGVHTAPVLVARKGKNHSERQVASASASAPCLGPSHRSTRRHGRPTALGTLAGRPRPTSRLESKVGLPPQPWDQTGSRHRR